jgi:hypothetical protein
VPNGSIRVDGRLDDEAWQKAAPITDFIQKEPVEGAAPTDAMDVRIVYDDDVLYVGARMHSKDGRIQAPLGGATTSIRPSTSWSRSIRFSIAAPRWSSA